MNEAMDRVLAYRNLLAAEDHCDELIHSHDITPEDREFVEGMLKLIVTIRDGVMPEEKDSRFHCLAKHLSAAYEAAREIYKVTNDPDDYITKDLCHEALNDVLEKLWGRKLITCERCGNKEENELKGIQGKIGEGNADSSFSGESRDIIQGVSGN